MGSTQRTQSVNSNALPLTIVHPNHQLQLTISRCNSLQGSFSAPALWRLLLLWLSAKASVPTPMPPAACNHSVPVLHPAATPASKPTRRTAPSPSPHQPPRATRRPSATRTALPSKMATWATTSCGQYCDNASGCNAFNIYFERDPLLNPAPACPNPLPTTNIKCSLWGSSVSAATA